MNQHVADRTAALAVRREARSPNPSGVHSVLRPDLIPTDSEASSRAWVALAVFAAASLLR